MELLAEMDLTAPVVTFPRYEARFLLHLQEAAQRHLAEKSQIRDTLALLQIYHKVGGESEEKARLRVFLAREHCQAFDPVYVARRYRDVFASVGAPA